MEGLQPRDILDDSLRNKQTVIKTKELNDINWGLKELDVYFYHI